MPNLTTLDRYHGALLGLAAGDALGTTLEFRAPGTFKPIDDMVGGGPFGLCPGQWTDDTSMAACLATSLLTREGFDPGDQMDRYCRWYRQGYWSSTGDCFDIGNTVAAALRAYETTGEPFSGPTHERSAGNGSIMRLAPVPMAFADDPARALHYCAQSSRTTHGAQAAIDACIYFGGLILGALLGEDRHTLLATRYSPAPGYLDDHPLVPEIDEIAAGSFKDREPPQIQGSGYVVRSLEAALWAFHNTDNFRDGALLAVNLGDDADTTGAVYGQIAGAYYGAAAIPAAWRRKLTRHDDLQSLASDLCSFMENP